MKIKKLEVKDDPKKSIDITYEAFLSGEVNIPFYLLRHVHISCLHYIFSNLSEPHRKGMRATILALMMVQCQSRVKLERFTFLFHCLMKKKKKRQKKKEKEKRKTNSSLKTN